MTSTRNSDTGHDATPGSRTAARWTLASLVRRHPRVAGASLALVIVLVAVTILTSVSDPHRQPLSDSASCSQWAAATPAQQTAYAHLYINEYGRFANTAGHAAALTAAIDKACTHASYLGEADDISILASLRHAF
ncbi:MAG TPA: hypothetical protein VGL69_05205 [Solirubrobacteraceae bacterium]|jgi:hypothetical protein